MDNFLNNSLFSACLGALGGFARILTGVAPRDSLGVEFLRIFFIAFPFGWLAGGLAEDFGWSNYMQHSFSIFVGMASLNLAKAASDVGVKNLFSAAFNILRGKL